MTALEMRVRRALQVDETSVRDIAEECGVSREFVSRVRARMRQEKPGTAEGSH